MEAGQDTGQTHGTGQDREQDSPAGQDRTLTVAEAARTLGISVEATRKRLQRGQLSGVKVDGTWFVHLSAPGQDSTSPGATGRDRTTGPRTRPVQPQTAALVEQLAYLREALTAKDQQIAELHVLLQRALEQRPTLELPASAVTPAQSETSQAQPVSSWWTTAREGKKGLGASLTLTGFVAITAGIILHLALRANVIASETHLGYVIGLVGLLSLLIGLVLVF